MLWCHMTSIEIDSEVEKLLNGLKISEQESINSVVKRLAMNAYDDEPLTEKDIKAIEEAKKEYVEGKCHNEKALWAEIEKERKIKLMEQ
jgi:hypothetical protein